MKESTRYITDHIITREVELVPVLCQNFLNEHVGGILAYYGCFPDRLIVFSKRVEYLYSTYRRRNDPGGSGLLARMNAGYRFKSLLRAALNLPHTILQIEIKWEVIHVDSSNLGFRDLLEAVFNNMIDIVEIAAEKSLTTLERNNVTRFLTVYFSRDWWSRHYLSAGACSLPDAVHELSAFSTNLEREKLALL